MQAVILAGGKGTRLKELTAELPKPMVKVGDSPIIEHQIRLLKTHGITDILILINHLKEPLINFLGTGEKFGVNITYYEEPQPLGTAGAFPLVKKELQETFLILYGDVMMDMDFDRLLTFHQKNQADATLVVHPNDHPHDSDLVEMNSASHITAFHSKPHLAGVYYKNMVNAGVYVFNKSVINHLPGPVKGDFGKDIFPDWIKKLKVFGYNTPEYLKDMGTLDRLAKVTEDLESGKIARRNLRNKQKSIFLDRDGVLNEDRHLIHTPEELVLYPQAFEAVKKINQSDYLGIVATNQSVVARNLCTIEELEYIHKKMDTELGEKGAKLDQLYYCPYHPDKGYPEENPEYKKEHPWRKPSPGMLLQGAEDFNIDLSQSYMIGDRESDILAGKQAGTITVAVKTGHGYKNASNEPDYLFQDVSEAVAFIIDDPLKENIDQIIGSIKTQERTQLILIGGNSQSGKSTLAKRLSIGLNDKKITNRILSLDHFLLPKEERENAKDVFERFDVVNLSEKIATVLDGKPLTLNRYHKSPSIERESFTFQLSGENILILEGIVALADVELRSLATSKIFVSQTIDQYKKRFYDLYDWKGLSQKETEILFASRVKDEFERIEATRTHADTTINPW